METWRGHCCCCQVDLALPEGGSFAYFATNSCAQESGGGIAGGGGRRRCSGTGGQVVKVSLRAQARPSRGAAPLSARTNCFLGPGPDWVGSDYHVRWAGSGGRGREGGGTVTNPSKSEKKAGGGSVGEPFQSDGTSVHDGRRGGGGEGEAHRHPPGLDQVDQGAAGYDAAPISNCPVAGWRAATQPVRRHTATTH